MRYFVGHKVSGAAEEYYYRITAELAEKFGVKDLGKRVAPHVTLKAPFESEETDKFEEALAEIARSQDAVRYEIAGFGSFDHDQGSTIFLDVKASERLQNRAQAIRDRIAAFGRNKNSLPDKLKMHVSIARYLKKEKEAVWAYLYSAPPPRFEAFFDNLALFRYRVGGWDIVKEFRF